MDCKEGTISQIKDDRIVVLIERRSACSTCHARGSCLSSDKDEQLIEVSDYPLGVQVGDRVRLIPAKGGSPLKAVLFAFVIPIILLAVLSIGMNMGGEHRRRGNRQRHALYVICMRDPVLGRDW